MNKKNEIAYSKSNKVFFGLSSFQMLAMFRRGLFYTYLSIYMRSYLGLSVTATTLFATLPMLVSVLSQNFLWGKISDKLQKRRSLIISGELIAGILLIFLYFLHYYAVSLRYAGYILIGGLSVIEFFWSMSNIGWSALISDIYNELERSRAMSRLTSLGGFGRILGVMLGGLLYDGFKLYYEGWGFREGILFFSASAVMFISILPMLLAPEGGTKLYVKLSNDINVKSRTDNRDYKNISNKIQFEQLNENDNEIHNGNDDEIQDEIQSQIQNKILNKFSDKIIVETNTTIPDAKINPENKNFKIFIVFIIALAFINFGHNSVSIIFPQYLDLNSGFNVSSELLSYIVNVRSIAIIIIGIFAGDIGEKIGHGASLVIGTVIMIISMILVIIAAVPTGIIFIYFSMFARGTAEVIITAASYTYAANLIPEEKRGKLFALYNMTFFLSWGLAGTLISGPTIDYMIRIGFSEVASYISSYYIAIGLTLIGILIFISLELVRSKERKKI